MKGWIYKISHKRKKDGKNLFPGFCYIGQHRGKSILDRFRGHKNDAKNFERKETQDKEGKHAKLHEVMRVCNPVNFVIESLEEFEHSKEIELINLLNQAELKYQKEYNSIEEGWNVVDAPQIKRIQKSGEKTLAQIARENDLPYTSLSHRVNKIGETIEEGIKHLKKYAKKTIIKYEYKRQTFENIRKVSESKLHNKNKLDKKTIERRIKILKESNKLKIKINEDKNEKVYVLIDKIFKPTRKYDEYQVQTPEGDIVSGLIIDLHKDLLKRFPNQVPEKYTTVQGRLNKSNWNIQQAFGFEYPPDLMEIKPLIENQGYEWAVKKPDFRKSRSYKPVIFESTKEIFLSQSEFSNEYGIANDLVSDHLKAGKTPEEVRDYFWAKNN